MSDLSELSYVLLVFGLFVIPRVLQHWRMPRAITALFLGAIAGMGFHLFEGDATISLLSTLGISTLFLFAGLEVHLEELQQGRRVLVQHVAVWLVLIGITSYASHALLGLGLRPSLLVALALLTPSAGFILDSLGQFGLTKDQVFWVRSKTISAEIVALLVLFFVLQSSSLARFALGTAALVLLIVVLPKMFELFARWIAPIAPRSEFAFLVMMTMGAAFATRQLGAYYLVGAFVVGIVAQRFREHMPAMASEEMLHAVDVFASFFIPFYFFGAGLHLQREQFTPASLIAGLAFLAVMVPLRIATMVGHRRLALGEPVSRGWRVSASLAPTLVFTLVTAEILRDYFAVESWLIGGLVIYTIGNTLLPGFVLHLPQGQLDDPELPAVSMAYQSTVSAFEEREPGLGSREPGAKPID